ncbi:hypothetical protein H6G04_30075 [Calothrix membranacea FACHB-236]|nr:hypothetical protein [Calothrix membranacea FACHB-236]
MTKQLRVSIPEDLHPWLDKMSESTEIRDYSRLVSYLLQRMKDEAIFAAMQQAFSSTTIPPTKPMQLATDIEIEVDW